EKSRGLARESVLPVIPGRQQKTSAGTRADDKVLPLVTCGNFPGISRNPSRNVAAGEQGNCGLPELARRSSDFATDTSPLWGRWFGTTNRRPASQTRPLRQAAGTNIARRLTVRT